MGDSEKHQCRVCDMMFHSYDELERHCALHINKDNPETTPHPEIVSTFAISTSADSVVDSKLGINLVPKTEASGNSENCTKLSGSTNVVQAPLLSNIKVEKSDRYVLPGTIVPSIIKIKVEKTDQSVIQSDFQSDKSVVHSDAQPDQAMIQSDPQSSSSNQNGFTESVKQPSEIVLKFPNIFSAISKPPASSQNQPQVPAAKRKQGNSDNEKGRVIKRVRMPDSGFACHLCGERFNKKDKLRQHMHSHMKEKFFKCDICGEKFLDKTQLDLHRPKHFFKCENCDEGFVKYADLKAHSVKHDSVSKFTCFICRKSFPYKSILMAHIDIHNTGAFECDHCFAKFNGRSQLSKHYFAHHSTPKKDTQATANSVQKETSNKTVNKDGSKISIHKTTDSESFQGINIKIKTEVPNK